MSLHGAFFAFLLFSADAPTDLALETEQIELWACEQMEKKLWGLNWWSSWPGGSNKKTSYHFTSFYHSSPIAISLGSYMDKAAGRRPCTGNIFTQDVSVLSRSCLGHVSVLSRWCLGHVSVVSRTCLGLVSVLSRWCLGHVSVVSRSCLGHVSVMSRSCLGDVSVMSRSCLGHVSVLSRFFPNSDKLGVLHG